MKANYWYIIPARKGSKGFPLKNRYLFDFTAKAIKHRMIEKTIVTTDDDEIITKAIDKNFKCLNRSEELSNDTASMKDVLLDVVEKFGIGNSDNLVLLYLTYPQRTFEDITKAKEIYETNKYRSLLCKENPLTHPCLCVWDDGSQVVEHDLYRRQDYPKAWEISHFIGIFKVSELPKLGKNLYNENTFYMEIERPFDVDYKTDYDKFIEKEKV